MYERFRRLGRWLLNSWRMIMQRPLTPWETHCFVCKKPTKIHDAYALRLCTGIRADRLLKHKINKPNRGIGRHCQQPQF